MRDPTYIATCIISYICGYLRIPADTCTDIHRYLQVLVHCRWPVIYRYLIRWGRSPVGIYPYGSGLDFLKIKYPRVGSGSTRGLTRGVPYSDQIAIFQLGIGDECLQCVHVLIKNDVYVYPGHWAMDKDGKVCSFFLFLIHHLTPHFKPVWMVKNSVTNIQIYLNPGLINLIKTSFFNGPTGFGYKFKEHYISLHPDHKEPELTIPIVALSATAVSSIFSLLSGLSLTQTWWYKFFAVLYEWHEGKKGKMSSDSQKGKAEKFEGDNFK